MAQGRQQLATTRLELQREVEPIIARIDEVDEALRDYIRETDEPFTERIDGLGTVVGKRGCDREEKGTRKVLDQAIYRTLAKRTRDTLERKKVVLDEAIIAPARKPSIEAKLAKGEPSRVRL